MVNLYKQFEELATQWKFQVKRDKFLLARIRLAVIYVIPALFFLLALSYVLYHSLFSQLTESAYQTIGDEEIRLVVLNNSSDIIKNLIFLGDGILLFVVMIAGFFLTKKTLEPIQDMMEKQDRFIADASHELRTPLSVIKTDIEVTLNQKNLSVNELKKTLQNIVQEVDILTKLSNDLLNISKEHSINMVFDKIHVPTMINNVIKRMLPIAEEKKIKLEFSGAEFRNKFIIGSESMLSQVVYNLISNAVRYTPEKGLIKVSYFIGDRKCIISVSDNGIGIKKENLEHIFDPFYRADNARVTPGSGLGLAIVKTYVELHSGIIEVKSKLEKGTTFNVILPVV